MSESDFQSQDIRVQLTELSVKMDAVVSRLVEQREQQAANMTKLDEIDTHVRDLQVMAGQFQAVPQQVQALEGRVRSNEISLGRAVMVTGGVVTLLVSIIAGVATKFVGVG
ncbi:MAG: hypothetical protein HQL53_09700 [Magnetococcales bacterium]|nr:hypothetical protein [Magnetococcales bacterium]